jgi:GT2 family glycosyltransferase
LRQVVEAVESALAQTPPPLEVVVVVDHNPELLAAIAAQVDRSVIVTDNTFARGLSGARNAGVAMACGDIVAFLDDDAIAAPDCFARLAERCAEADVIGAGALIAPLWASAPPSWFPPEFLWVVGCSYDGLQPGETRNLLGAAMCVRREAFASVGGFESGLGRTAASLPFGCEETEWCIRASQTIGGGRFLFDPQARVGHHVPAERASWRYFLRRCYAEGLSKAYLSRLVGTGTSLASERRYVSHALVAAAGRRRCCLASSARPGVMGSAGRGRSGAARAWRHGSRARSVGIRFSSPTPDS